MDDAREIFIIFESDTNGKLGNVMAVNIGCPVQNETFADEWAKEWRGKAGIIEDEMTQGNCEHWLDVMGAISSLQLPISMREFPKCLHGISLSNFNAID